MKDLVLDAGFLTALGTATAAVLKALAILITALRARRDTRRCTCETERAPEPIA